MRPELRIVRKEASIVSINVADVCPDEPEKLYIEINWVARAACFLPSRSRQRWSWPPLFAGSFYLLEEFFCRCAGFGVNTPLPLASFTNPGTGQ